MSNLNFLHSGGNKVTLSAPTSDPSSNPNFKLPQADGSSGQFLKTDGSGALSFANTYGPAFRAFRNSDMNISHNSVTIVQFNVESFDTDNCYNTSNYRFTPNKAGYYSVYCAIRYTLGTQDHLYHARIYKNNSDLVALQQDMNKSSGGTPSVNVHALVPMNGTSDYLDCRGYQNSGYTHQMSGGSSGYDTWFDAYWVRPL